GKLYRDEAGRPARMTGICMDVTERQLAQEERRKFVALVEQTDDFISMTGLDARLIYVNRAGSRLAGLDPAQAAGTPIGKFHPDQWWRKLEDEIFPSIVRGQGGWVGEAQIRHIETGHPIDVLMNVFPVNHPDT